MPSTTRVSFIIPVKNDAARLARCLAAVAQHRLTTGFVEIIVADNGSTDGSTGVAKAAGARVLVMPDLNVAQLRNSAAEAARGEILAFVDADHVVVPGWASAVVGMFGDDTVGAAGAIYAAPADGTWVQRVYGALRGQTTEQAETTWLGSGNLAVRRTAFQGIQGFDPSLEACEDVDLCHRLRAAGWKVVADPRLASVHLGDPATLGALFRAERWRGRDNLRVSFRGTMTPRDLPSALIPVIDLAGMVAAVWAILILPTSGRPAVWTLIGAIGIVLALSAVRVLRVVLHRRIGPQAIFPAFLVALVWDVARALALVWPGPHHRRRDDGPTPSGAAAL